jgi:hypothetical protein
MKRRFAVLLPLITGLPVLAADPADDALPAPPVIPPPVQSGEALEPEVTIVESDRGTVYEYRVNGNLYMVKVQPSAGPPYYLLDLDGDGQMDVRQDEPWNNSVPQWVLYSW